MVNNLSFEGRVVVVTGAGAGLGRSYALLFGERGASVVVNDLGGGRHGDGNSTRAADMVVQEIHQKGGKAVADYHSVTDGEKIIETALEHFGRIDVVVNNAGILRDKSFARISNTDWDLIHDVHLKGSFKTTQAAWPHFRKQNYGRVIMTCSNSGLYGNFGQANYSAAKMGAVGLSNTLAIEGKKNDIHCNVIVPTAASRLTEDILPPEFFAELRPELIAPVVVWLCHESCSENGAIIEAAAGWATKCHLVRGPGALLRTRISDLVSPEDVQRLWPQVTDMSDAKRLDSIEEASGTLMSYLEEMKGNEERNSATTPLSVDATFTYTNRDCIIYALGVGASVKNPGDLRFLYEGHSDFGALPAFAILPGQMACMSSDLITSAIPGKEIELSQVLHGEQYVRLLKPFPSGGTLTSRCTIADVLDKNKGAVVLCDFETFDESNELLVYGQMSVYIVGGGGFGGKRTSDKEIPTVEPPSRRPDAMVTQKTIPDQAVLYRLSGDLNPLHIDPDFARISGFQTPILHGLASFGVSARHVLQEYGGNDPGNCLAIKARFAKPVVPGETLKTEMWLQGNRVHFRASVVGRGDVVLSGAYMDLKEVLSPPEMNSVSSSSSMIEQVFIGMEEKINADLPKLKAINGVFFYQITNNGAVVAKWTVDLKNGLVYQGEPREGTKVDTTLTVSDEDMVDIALGKLNPQTAFMKGKLKIKGNIMLVQKLKVLMTESKL